VLSSRVTIALVATVTICAEAPYALAQKETKIAEDQALYKQGIAHKKSGDLDLAIAAFEACLKINPKHTLAMYHLGWSYKKKGDNENAEKYFALATKNAPDYGPAHLALGQVLLTKGAFPESRKAFEAALAAKEMANDDKAETWSNIGISYRYEAKYSDASKAFDEAIKLAPANWTYYHNKAVALNQSGDKAMLSDAITAAKKASELAPKEFGPWNTLGNSYRRSNKPDEAIAAYEKAVAIDPKAADVWYDLASMYMKKEQYQKALDGFQTYLKLAKPGADTSGAEDYVEQLKKKVGKK
jgi:tetratricopeptide (TPR) repeat protein